MGRNGPDVGEVMPLPTNNEPKYPILMVDPVGADLLDIGCNACGQCWMAKDVDDSIEWVEVRGCKFCGSAMVEYRYAHAIECGGCGALAVSYPKTLDYCCSRPCMLQKAYKAELRVRRMIEQPKATRDDVADEYRAVLNVKSIDWSSVNAAILERWSPAGLAYIKARAWAKGEVPA